LPLRSGRVRVEKTGQEGDKVVWGESREGELEAVGEQEGLEAREVDSREAEVKNRAGQKSVVFVPHRERTVGAAVVRIGQTTCGDVGGTEWRAGWGVL
jgi:hypothetical protein